jgi:hypothetical protein
MRGTLIVFLPVPDGSSRAHRPPWPTAESAVESLAARIRDASPQYASSVPRALPFANRNRHSADSAAFRVAIPPVPDDPCYGRDAGHRSGLNLSFKRHTNGDFGHHAVQLAKVSVYCARQSGPSARVTTYRYKWNWARKLAGHSSISPISPLARWAWVPLGSSLVSP